MSEELIISNFIKHLKELESKNKDSNKLMEETKGLVKKYNTFRVDIKNKKNKDNDISVISCSDDNAEIIKPRWISDSKGKGVVVQGETGFLNLEFICIGEGILILTFRGADYKNESNKREPIYVECMDIKVDGENILEKPVFITHDNFYRYRINVVDGQKIKLSLSWNTLTESGGIAKEYGVDGNFDKKFKEMHNQLKLFKKETKDILDSHYNLFNTLFKYYELKPKGIMEKIQGLNVELINFIDNVCHKYDLQYWIDYGTLLGAIRHEGFIPWDDDVDLGMMRKDYDKLFSILKKEVKLNNLDEYITVERMERINDNNYLISFIKLSYRVNSTLFGFIDIFPYDYRHSDKGIDAKIFNSEKKLFYKRIFDGEDKQKVLNDYLENLSLTYEVSDFVITGVDSAAIDVYGFQIMEKDMIFPLKSTKFNNREYPCPNKSEEYLKKIYGDYENIPKIIRNHGLINLKRNVDNEKETYERNISRFKKINQNFE